jgi:hypothetical protein
VDPERVVVTDVLLQEDIRTSASLVDPDEVYIQYPMLPPDLPSGNERIDSSDFPQKECKL